jgi:hypothetical protein
MMTHDFGEYGSVLIDQLLALGFERPIALAAIASNGLTTAGSSETITGSVAVRCAPGATMSTRVAVGLC